MRYLTALVFIALMSASAALACRYPLRTHYGFCSLDGAPFSDSSSLCKLPEASKDYAEHRAQTADSTPDTFRFYGEPSIQIIAMDPYVSAIMLPDEYIPGLPSLIMFKDAPKCPKDGMLVFRYSYTPEDIAILKSYVATPEYQKMLNDEASGWVVAKLQEKLGVPLAERRYALLQATWQVAGDKFDFYARETIKAIEAFLLNPTNHKEGGLETWQLLLGELYRRVGDF